MRDWESADIILFGATVPSRIARTISSAQQRYGASAHWTHAALYIGRGRLIEAIVSHPKRVLTRGIDAYVPGRTIAHLRYPGLSSAERSAIVAAQLGRAALVRARRVPTPNGRAVVPGAVCVDRVDAVLSLCDSMVMPRAAAALGPARLLLGTVVRAAGWLYGVIEQYPHDAFGRRAAVLALAALGESVPSEIAVPDPTEAHDVAAACLAAALAHIAPQSDTARWAVWQSDAKRWGWPDDAAQAEAVMWPAMERAVRALEDRTLAADGADAAFDVARRALMRVRERRWWKVIEG